MYWVYAQSTGCRVLGVLGDVLYISGWAGSMFNLQNLQLGGVLHISYLGLGVTEQFINPWPQYATLDKRCFHNSIPTTVYVCVYEAHIATCELVSINSTHFPSDTFQSFIQQSLVPLQLPADLITKDTMIQPIKGIIWA